jgi:NADP-dependent 3-hydroxy acid dehydrogenase YdfG
MDFLLTHKGGDDMAGGLDAKVVLITGASSGIGEATVRLVAKQDGLPVLSARHAPTD